ncbi:MAG: hypothetical protein ABI377_11960 [Devosia sp.]
MKRARIVKDKLNLAEVSAIGIGGMIGGGIFAVLGLAIATAGHAVVLTLAGGGVIAIGAKIALDPTRIDLILRADAEHSICFDRPFCRSAGPSPRRSGPRSFGA